MGDYQFSSMPSVSIARTKFNRTMSHNLSFNLGELCVLQCQEIIPGSTHKLDYGSLIRMSTPIAPIMDDIQYDIYTFFCPMRLTWSNFKQFMGENLSGSGALNSVNSNKTIPAYNTCGSAINSIADDMGIPAFASGNNLFSVNMLPFRAFFLIYNRWFRNQNVEAPAYFSLGDSAMQDSLHDLVGLSNSAGQFPSGGAITRPIAYKLPDYFTSALPYAQKGDPVSIFPEGALAPVYINNTTGSSITSATTLKTSYVPLQPGINTANALVAPISGGNLPVVADLRGAVDATINNLRFAFQLQKFLEKDALYGSRYWEILYAHYSVTSPDASLQDPELIGHVKFDINVQQVLQTTGFASPSNTNLGTPGANSTTGKTGSICTSSFCEHGYLITIGVARQKNHTYSQGLNRMWSRSARTDFYFPVFANLGAQKVLNKEIDVQSAHPDAVFGYQEAWADYRFLPSYNSGLLNPVRPSSLDYWTLAENFSATPTLSTSFLKVDRVPLSRALVTGPTGPDFVASFYFRDTTVNPMPLYSIPGFADHH